MLLVYECFRFSEVMDQMFLTVRGAVQGSFRATLSVASVFIHVVLRKKKPWGGGGHLQASNPGRETT